MDEQQELATHAIIARRDEFASPMTLEALDGLTAMNAAGDRDPVAICLPFRETSPTTDPLPTKEPICWAPKGKRLLSHRLTEVNSRSRLQAALAMGLILEDQLVTRNITFSRFAMCERNGIERIQLHSFLLPGAIIVARWAKNLALYERRDAAAADHLATHFEVSLNPELSAHDLVNVIPNVEAVLSDLASFGTFQRHLVDSLKHTDPPRHKISLRLA